MDSEASKLGELTSQLVRVQAETNDARSKQKSGSAGDVLPEVMGDSVVAGLRSEISKQEARLQEAGLNLGVNHPQYLRMQSEVAALKQKLETETRHVTSSFFCGEHRSAATAKPQIAGRNRRPEEKAARNQKTNAISSRCCSATSTPRAMPTRPSASALPRPTLRAMRRRPMSRC